MSTTSTKSTKGGTKKGTQWFCAIGENILGPYSTTFLGEMYQKDEISAGHYVIGGSHKDWVRMADCEEFEILFPVKPKKKPDPENTGTGVRANESDAVKAEWFLFFNEAQNGPFSTEEVERLLLVGKVHGRVHAWAYGMKDWARLESLTEFRAAAEAALPLIEEARTRTIELRSTPRKPLVAKIVVAGAGKLVMGICQDLSVGGMLVLTNDNPGPPGAVIRLNVSPTGSGSGSQPLMNPFAAEGVVVRRLEGGHGFSFRFTKLDPHAKEAIEAYLGSS